MLTLDTGHVVKCRPQNPVDVPPRLSTLALGDEVVADVKYHLQGDVIRG